MAAGVFFKKAHLGHGLIKAVRNEDGVVAMPACAARREGECSRHRGCEVLKVAIGPGQNLHRNKDGRVIVSDFRQVSPQGKNFFSAAMGLGVGGSVHSWLVA